MAGGKLKFKGEKHKKHHKKRKHTDLDGFEDDGPTVVAAGSRDTDGEGWVNPPEQKHILGPLYIICISPSASAYGSSTLSGSGPCAIAIFPTPVSPVAKVGPAQLSKSALETLEPDDINHVHVCARVLDSVDKITLRASNGRFLASNEVGEVQAEREARGMQEEWAFETVGNEEEPEAGPSNSKSLSEAASPANGVFALKSVAYGKYLSVEEVAGGKLELRCDSDKPLDQSSHFLVRMQAQSLVEAKKRLAEEQAKRGLASKQGDMGLTILNPGQTLTDLEAAGVRQAHTRGAGRLVTSSESTSALKKARKEGRLGEELLDRRSKLKSDRYC